MQLSDNSLLLEALRKNYEERTPQEHRVICHTIAPCFPTQTK